LAKKIFVGNLPLDASEAQLTAWFRRNGFPTETVSISVDRLSGQPRGFGFVEMSEQLAQRCIVACNGQDFLGRTLVINQARAVQERRASTASKSVLPPF
jgi:RNA recognition motif-containing protein